MGKRKITGKLDKHHKGFGFVIRDDGIKPDIYVKEKNQKRAMDNDKVAVHIISYRGTAKPEGRIVKILERKSKKTIGTFVRKRNWQGVLPLGSNSEKIDLIKNKLFHKVKNGDRVYVHLEHMPTKRKNAVGHIVEILGPAGRYETEIKITLLNNGIREKFNKEIIDEVKNIPENINEISKNNREDLRELNCFTIDPEDARDFDDAVSIKETKKGYELGVHIADVSHFVKESSAIDKEAFKRGTSVYLVDRVIPMLPESISNGICSLKPGEDRFAVSVFIYLNKKGKVKNYDFKKSIICSKHRFTYDEVDEILKNGKFADKKIQKDLKLMAQLAEELKKRGEERGRIDFELPEFNIKLNKDGFVKSIKRKKRTASHRLIEEFMILANEIVAGHMYENNVICLYRNHEQPSGEKLESFRNFIKLFGFTLPEDKKITSQHLQTILDKISKSKERMVITTLMLRSLQQAIYSNKNKGHFALASENYTHFTSPIRRYPDLVVHRILSDIINNGQVKDSRQRHYNKKLAKWAEKLSERERAAEQSERESKELKTMEFMKDRIGEKFIGIISGITSFGIFVELQMGLEGLIRLSDLKDDYYEFFEKQMCLYGKKVGKKFKIGDEIRVKLVRVDLSNREVDFIPV